MPESPNPDMIADVAAMHEKFGMKIPSSAFERIDFLTFRMLFQLEEVGELFKHKTPDEKIDALIDSIVVAIGTLHMFEVDIPEAWRRVHEANMTKMRGTKSTRPGSGGVDLIKPSGWQAPDHSDNTGLMPEKLLNYGPDYKIWRVIEVLCGAYSNMPCGLEPMMHALEIQIKKHADYNTGIKQAEYYPRGLHSILDMINTKYLRLRSLLSDENGREPKFESVTDSLLDLINYAAYGIAYVNQRMPGSETKDIHGKDIHDNEAK